MSKYRITLEGKTYEMEVELVPEKENVQTSGRKEYKEFKSAAKDPTIMVVDPASERMTASSNKGAVISPMPGTVMKIEKAEGDSVKAGEVVLILEAMKMENEITSPIDGKIVKINCVQGKAVEGGTILFEVQ